MTGIRARSGASTGSPRGPAGIGPQKGGGLGKPIPSKVGRAGGMLGRPGPGRRSFRDGNTQVFPLPPLADVPRKPTGSFPQGDWGSTLARAGARGQAVGEKVTPNPLKGWDEVRVFRNGGNANPACFLPDVRKGLVLAPNGFADWGERHRTMFSLQVGESRGVGLRRDSPSARGRWWQRFSESLFDRSPPQGALPGGSMGVVQAELGRESFPSPRFYPDSQQR